jgi:hypothetical protein
LKKRRIERKMKSLDGEAALLWRLSSLTYAFPEDKASVELAFQDSG